MQKPKEIINIYDNSGTEQETLDCMTFVLDWEEGPQGQPACLGTSRNGLGFSQFSYCDDGEHLGNRVSWDSLSTELKKHVAARLK